MERELIFRAWHRKEKLMYWWNPLWGNYGHGQGYIGMVLVGESETKRLYKDNIRLIDPSECDIMQFTGIKDRDGVEIYEGDIVRYFQPYSKRTDTHIVQWDEQWACFGLFEKDNRWCKESDWAKIQSLEVIGNIYANPDLLK